MSASDRDTDTYAMLDTRDWTQPRVLPSHGHRHHHHHRPPPLPQQQQLLQNGDLSLKSLNKDWHGVIRNIGHIGSVVSSNGAGLFMT